MSTGVLLINLGTPDNCDQKSVKRYLDEFLMDPYVVDIPFLARWLLVKGIILRTRPKQSAHAYQQIWTEQGSPLLLHSVALTHKVAQQLPQYKVKLGMRYSKPSIASAAKELLACQEIIVLPLFPQYSLAATESALAQAQLQLQKMQFPGKVTLIEDFYNNTNFIQAVAEKIQQQHQPDYHLLLSYHGLPVKQINKVSSCEQYCDRLSACPAMNDSNRRCYRAQCFATSKAIQTQLQLNDDQVSTSFQSRLGKLPWIQPYTDELLPTLIAKGIRNISVACPSFMVDCLETLEEIGLRAKADWRELGGNDLQLIPCINDSELAVKTIIDIVT